jgi:phosphomannomutase
MNYIFDIDGTLTPSRLRIDPEFEIFFLEWMKNKNVYLVTGSDKDKTIEQVGEKIWTNAKRAYQSCGNAVYENGELIRAI